MKLWNVVSDFPSSYFIESRKMCRKKLQIVIDFIKKYKLSPFNRVIETQFTPDKWYQDIS